MRQHFGVHLWPGTKGFPTPILCSEKAFEFSEFLIKRKNSSTDVPIFILGRIQVHQDYRAAGHNVNDICTLLGKLAAVVGRGAICA